MITNLFSIFDPSSSLNLPLNWIAALLRILFVPLLFWSTKNRFLLGYNLVSQQVHKEFKTLVGPTARLGHTLIFTTILIMIAVNNFLGLFPYIFTSTSHISITLTLALPLWLRFIIYGWFNHTTHMLAHMVPNGTPAILIPFIVLIETIRNIIRPGTLAVRLTANIIAGHLLLVLLGNQGPSASFSVLSVLLVVQILLLTLERAVALIQAYVFAVLTTLYSREVSYVNTLHQSPLSPSGQKSLTNLKSF